MKPPFSQLVEYRIVDLSAELAFWCERVGMRLILEEPDYAIIGHSSTEFRLALRRAASVGTSSDALSVQFWCEDLNEQVRDLAARGLLPTDPVRVYAPEHRDVMTCGYKTAAGISFRLWGPGYEA